MEAAEIDLNLDIEPGFEPQIRERSNTWPLRPNRDIEPQNSPSESTEEANLGVCDQHVNGKDPLGLTAKKSGSRRNAWGNLSYADLITKAIQSSHEKRLTLSQIYDWMVQNVPYFKDKGDSTSSAGWKNSIRHNLSLHNRFMRIQNEGTGKSSWWVINPDAKPGKTPRRRAGSMETKSYEKKRGRVRKRLEAHLAAVENGTLSPGVSEDYLDALSLGDFRSRASSNASSCGRLSPIHAVIEPDLHDNQVPPMSPIPWGTEVSGSPTLYHNNDNYSDLVDSLVDGMKLTSQDSIKMELSSMNDPYLSGTAGDFNGQSQGFLSEQPSTFLDTPERQGSPYSHLPAPPPYPKQQASNKVLEFRQNFSNGVKFQTSPVNVQSSPSHYQSDLFSDGLMIKTEPGLVNNIDNTQNSPSVLSVNVNTPQLGSPDRSQQSSPNSATFTSHLSPQSQLVNGQVSPIACQLSPHLNQQVSLAASPLQAQQQTVMQQNNQASILREALTRGPLAFRNSPTNNTSNFAVRGNVLQQSSPTNMPTSNINTTGMINMGLNAGSPHHHQHHLNASKLRTIQEHISENPLNTNCSHLTLNNGLSSGNMPNDIDLDLISDMDFDMDSVIKQELVLEGNLDFNFESAPSNSVEQNVH